MIQQILINKTKHKEQVRFITYIYNYCLYAHVYASAQ